MNFNTVSQAILRTVYDYGIKEEDVIAIISDNASYCIKAFNNVLTSIFVNAVHVRCLDHILNLVGECWKDSKHMSNLKDFVEFFKSASSKREQESVVT